MNKKYFVILAVAAAIMFWQVDGRLDAAGPSVLKSAGCKTEYFLLQDLSKVFANTSGTVLQLGKTGNNKAINLLLDRQIDFAFTCKSIEQLAEKLQLDPRVIERWKSVPIAKDPIVIVSNKQNGAQELTLEQLADIFQGDISNWKDVGGNDLPVLTAYINPELESGVAMHFQDFILDPGEKLDGNARVADGPSMLGNYIAMTPGAVTFMGYNSYQEKFGDIVAVDGALPTRENILSGKYGLAVTYYLTLAGDEHADVSEFLDFVRSEEGKRAIEMNFIPISE